MLLPMLIACRLELCFFSLQSSVRTSSIQVRLVSPDPRIPFMGRLEVFYNDTWGTVCDDFFSSADARVACGMLNYTDALCSVPNAQFGEGEGRELFSF